MGIWRIAGFASVKTPAIALFENTVKTPFAISFSSNGLGFWI
jgi:hypothetical protein